MEKTKPKMVNYLRPVYTAEDSFKVIDNIIKKHTHLSFVEAVEADHALNSLILQHTEDLELSKNGMINDGIIATKLGLQGIPEQQ